MTQKLKSEMKVIAKHSSIYGLSNILNRIVSIIMLPLYTSYLTTADYGVLELLYFVLTLISIVLAMGISEGMSRFFFDTEDQKERNKVISTSIIGFGALSILTGFSLLTSTEFFSKLVFDTNEYSLHFIFVFLTLSSEFSIQSGLAYFRVEKMSSHLLYYSLAHLIITVSLNILFLVHYELGVIGILAGTLSANVIVGLVMQVYILGKVGLKFSYPLYKDLIKFGLPLIPSTMATYLMIASDRFFIKEFVSLNQTGLYSLGYKIGSIMHRFVTSPFIQIWYPRRFEYFGKDDAEAIFSRIFTYFTAVLAFVGMAVAILAQDILKILSTESFWSAYKVVPLIALAHVFHSFYYHFAIGISMKKKTVYYLYINIITGLLNLVLNYFLIQKYGIWGAAYATLMTYIIRASLVYYFSNKLYRIIFEKLRILKILIVAVTIYYFSRYLYSDTLFLDIVIKSLVIMGYPILLYLLGFFSEGELVSIKEQFLKYKNRIFKSS